MAYALYDLDSGYYAKAPKIGRSGDFYTSVSVGPLFGRLLALQAARVWNAIGKPSSFDLIEQGAHTGQLSVDLLTALSQDSPECYQASQLHFVEPSSSLQEAQKRTVPITHPKIPLHSWKTLHEIPNNHWSGFFYSNELVDSFPVRRIVFQQGQWQESFVEAAPDQHFRFVERLISSNDSLQSILPKLPAIEGYTTEINEAAQTWIREVARTLKQGLVLTIDYGFPFETYYAPERNQGTLRAYFQHRMTDEILERVGAQDLTAHVDFTTLSNVGEASGLQTFSFTDQHHYLVALAEPFLKTLESTTDPRNPDFQKTIRAFKTLMHPEMMGTRFQVLAQGKGISCDALPEIQNRA